MNHKRGRVTHERRRCVTAHVQLTGLKVKNPMQAGHSDSSKTETWTLGALEAEATVARTRGRAQETVRMVTSFENDFNDKKKGEGGR